MSDSFWQQLFAAISGMSEGAKLILGALVILGVLGAYALKLLFKRLTETREAVVEAKDQAALAATRSLPTSNGFAAGVQGQLVEISDAVIRIENQVERLSGRVAELERPSLLLPHRRRRLISDDISATESKED